jgi:hypothetical protein
MKRRAGEPPKTHFRAPDRCFQSNGVWYFSTREFIDVGPYPTRHAAEYAITKLTALLKDVKGSDAASKVIKEFKQFVHVTSGYNADSERPPRSDRISRRADQARR